ncbi:flagellar basal body-associated protein FliL [Parvularcula sp. IMCC14364]|uniref:flagellar basal body-associated FliL family protein n=1 Tax=Parvularcula sp. IMCC14364 TaxID=3067902 RepID=UPI002741B42A|nr:flagellar basal body-associated FliL family protein [Parvularcula sp. IMCC14364]
MAQENDVEPEAQDAEDKPKKSSGFIGQIILAVVMGGAAFGTVYFLPQEEPPVMECPSVFTERKEPEYKPPSLDKIKFVELEPLLVSLGSNPRSNTLKISLTLEADKEAGDKVLEAQPKLKDAFTAYLRAVEVAELEDPAMIVKLRAQLLRRAKVVLGPDAVHGVLITEFIVR